VQDGDTLEQLDLMARRLGDLLPVVASERGPEPLASECVAAAPGRLGLAVELQVEPDLTVRCRPCLRSWSGGQPARA